MKKMRSVYIGLAVWAVILAILGFLTFIPVPEPSEETTRFISVVLEDAYQSSNKDVMLVVQIDDPDRQNDRFYIERGVEKNVDVEILDNLKGQSVTIAYADYWSLRNMFSSTHHVYELRNKDGEIVYSEIE